MPGFRPAGIYEAGGIDNIGIYNGDPHIVVPLGPSYSLGPGQAWQLSAYYSAKFWHLDNPTRSCTTGGTSYPHARISGYPTLGAGWTLELGYVFAPAADNPANGVVYVAPDGSRHGVVLPSGTPSAITNDGSRLRIARTPTTGTITSYTVEFPDGTKQLFDHGYYAPSNVSAPDFADQNYTDATPAPLRRGLHTLTDAEGSTLLNVTYVSNITSSADAWKVDQIAIAAHTRKIIFTWGTAQVTDANNGNPTWPVLSSISFPSSGGGTQSVSFSFYGGTDSTVYPWPRNSYDEGPLTGTCKSPSTVAVPLLSAISDGTRLPYTFAYLKTTPDYTSRARALSDATLPETGTIHYDYDSFTPCFAECDDPETVAATVGLLAVPEPDPPPNCNLSNFLAKTPFVVARTTTDPVSNVSSRTTYDRYQYGPLVDLATCEFDESNVARSVLVTSYSGNGTGTVATRYLFHGESQSGSADGLELARRYYDEGADVSTATPFRSVINCWLGDSLPTTPICGLKSSAGATEPQAFPVLGSNVRQQAAVTWYGANPYPGGTCTGTSPTCLSTTNAITSWNATARRWATSTLNSTLSSWTTADSRDTTRVLVPQSTTKWLLDLFTDETITDSGPHATAPTTTKTTHAFNITTGFLESATTADATYGTLTRTFTDDGDGNPATIVTAGSGGLTGSFTDTLTFADGLVRTVQRSGLTVAWESLDVSRDLDTGLVTTSRDPHDLATTLHYDGLGRTIDVTPAGEGVETACYKNPSGGFPAWIILRKGSTTGASCITDDGAAPSGGWANTQEVVQYDGFGRVIREVRRRPTLAGTYFVRRETRYDNAGHRAYVSEWAPCPLITTPPPAKTTTDITNCLHPVPITPNPGTGTTWSDFDPLGRPRRVQIADGKTRDILYTDGSILHSDSYQKITVNGVGGTNPITYFRSDALGRTTSVQEPSVSGSADTTTYAYNIFDQVASVTQTRGGTTQTRSFTFDKLGLLRSETEPEGGTAAYTYDALGNPTSKTHGGVTYTMTYDQAGRLKIASADAHPTGTTYLMNCYDGTGNPCPDGTTANSNGGGSIFKGRLTKTVATNYIPTIASQVTHDYQYFASSGRVAADVTKIGNGDLSSTFTQSWTYSTLGQVATHNHPRASGTWQEVNSYSSGFPTKIVANGQTVAQNVTFNPASGISSWKAGNNVTTTIAQDSSFLPRPSSIATSGSTGGSFSSGAYAYDGAGNITGIGPDSFTYDARSRLKTATLSGQPQRIFSYDGFNNLTQNGSLTIGINAANNRITSGSALYDLGGNLTSYNSESMTFDAFNRLANKVSTAGNWTYLYDSGGERVVKFPNTSVLRREMARYIAEANIIAKGWTLPAACPSAFPGDVNCTTDPDAAYIKLLSTQGVTSGCGGTNFCPNLALTRGEMAKFLGKGYHANGFTPPACTGTMFGDVNCSGQFDAWIEEIGRDLVTSGCDAGGNNYCPANPIGEWEMLVFLAKGRHPATGPYVWTAYHPVPRGSIFTWRDENSRVATEAIGGGTPAAPQGYPTILIGRDNVYLGNMLVASYVTDSSYGTVGWQYYASDHLGTPRLVTTASAATIETRKYWPYGEEVTGQASTQYTRFAGMERDTAFSQYYDHARVQEFNLGRFLTPDLISGYPEEPKSWNRYSYVLGNPVLLVDPWGLCPGVCEDVEVNAPYIQVDPVAWPWVLGLISIGSGGVVTAPTAELSGDGTAGRSINERAPCTSGPSLQDISNFSAGFGDTVSLGLTSMVRSFTGANSAVDFASSSYRAGIAAGIAWHIAFQLAGFASGSEIAVGKNFRLAPWGNRTGNQYGRWPHYHRRAAPAPSGATPPGQGIGRHRPWETSPLDKCFGDRF